MRVTICSNLQRDVHVQNWLLVCLDINGVTNRPDEILDEILSNVVDGGCSSIGVMGAAEESVSV